MNPITVEAVYENGILKPTKPLPFAEHSKVQISIESADDPVNRSYGLIGWTGVAETVERVALSPEFGIMESP